VGELSGGLLVEAEDVAGRITESRSDFGRIRADRLYNLAAVGSGHEARSVVESSREDVDGPESLQLSGAVSA
jgi:hypothetical protein